MDSGTKNKLKQFLLHDPQQVIKHFDAERPNHHPSVFDNSVINFCFDNANMEARSGVRRIAQKYAPQFTNGILEKYFDDGGQTDDIWLYELCVECGYSPDWRSSNIFLACCMGGSKDFTMEFLRNCPQSFVNSKVLPMSVMNTPVFDMLLPKFKLEEILSDIQTWRSANNVLMWSENLPLRCTPHCFDIVQDKAQEHFNAQQKKILMGAVNLSAPSPMKKKI